MYHEKSGVNPPMPSTAASKIGTTGQQLLSLLRQLDRTTDDVECLQKTVDLMQDIVVSVQRRGLVQGDVELAEQVLARSTSTSSSSNVAASGNKNRKNRGNSRRGCKKGNNVSDLTMQTTETTEQGGSCAASLDVQLVMSAIARVLEGNTTTKSNNGVRTEVVVSLAADICTAACEYIKSQSIADSCFLAEYELMAGSGKSFLVGLEKHLRRMIPSSDDNDCQGSAATAASNDDESFTYYCVTACLRAAASLISLFNTKLSRSTAILKGLSEVAWDALVSFDDDGVLRAATTLLATLPFAGGTDRATPASLWNQALIDTVSALDVFIQRIAPILHKEKSDDKSAKMSDFVKQQLLDRWIPQIEKASSEDHKIRLSLKYTRVLVSLTKCLLAREAIGVAGAIAESIRLQLVDTEVNVGSMLDLIESMLSFSTAAEAKYYGTKKRLRLETVEEGMLSPEAIACKAANHIRLHGHELLDAIISALGASALLPYARRVIKMSCTALLNSSSTNLRKVIDQVGAMHIEGKKKRWLHTSITLRIAAVKSFLQTVVAMGIDPRSLSAVSSRSNKVADVDRSISIVCGFIVEELSVQSTSTPNDDWGSVNDRVQLVTTSMECLAACLSSGGEFMPATTRGLIDSMTSTCLLLAVSQTHPISCFAVTKASILKLGAAAVCTPWQDGASSSLANTLKIAARACQQDRDTAVAMTATSAISVCDALDCPRVPALNCVTRSGAFTNSDRLSKAFTVDSLAEKLQSAKEEAERIRIREEGEKSDVQMNPQKKAKKSIFEPQQKIKNVLPGRDIDSRAMMVAEKLAAPLMDKEALASGPGSATATAAINVTNVPTPAATGGTTMDAATKEKDNLDKAAHGDTDEEDDFPMIVDCGPDADDS